MIPGKVRPFREIGTRIRILMQMYFSSGSFSWRWGGLGGPQKAAKVGKHVMLGKLVLACQSAVFQSRHFSLPVENQNEDFSGQGIEMEEDPCPVSLVTTAKFV